MKRNQIITQAFRLCKRQSSSVLKAPAVALKPAQQRSFVKLQNVKISSAAVSNKRFYADKIVVVPGMGDSITEGTIQAWLKKENEAVEEDEVICQIETDKVTADVRSPGKGVVKQLFAKKGETVSVGQNLFVVDIGATASASAAPQQSVEKAEKPKAAEAPKPAAPQPAAPKAEAPKPAPVAEAPKAAPSAAQQPAASTAGAPSRNETRVQMTRMRKTIASRLKDSQNTYAMLTTFNEIDMSKLTDFRNKYKDVFAEKHGIKLGFMSAFVKASATALSEMPVVNAVIDGDDIVYRDFVDVSVAVATPKGLVVPVLRNCESKNFADIERDIFNFGEKAKKNQLTIPEMQGGTFTISNGGVFGSLMGTPIINPPQSAILGMHGIQKRPVVVNDQIVIRPMMYVALTYDHRLIDGREAVTFLRRVKELVEEPEKFLI